MAQRTQGQPKRAPALMILGAVGAVSLWPLLVDSTSSGTNPFLFNALVIAAQALALGLYLRVLHADLLRGDGPAGRLIRKPSSMFGWPLVWLAVGQLQFAMFVWSTRFVDTAISVALIQLWPFLFILMMTGQSARVGGTRPSLEYRRLTGEKTTILLFVLVGFVFVALSQTQRGTNLLSGLAGREFIGILLALVGALLVATQVWASLRLGDDLLERLHSRSQVDEMAPSERRRQRLVFSVVSVILTRFIGLPVALAFGLAGVGGGSWPGGQAVTGALIAGALLHSTSLVLVRKANLATTELTVNAVFYLNPVVSLGWLAAFTDIAVPQVDLLVIGAAAIVSVNILLNLDPEYRPDISRLGFKSLVLGLWAFGAFVYLRDDLLSDTHLLWPGGAYWTVLTVSATIFTLILSFRISRLTDRLAIEQHLVVSLFARCRQLCRQQVLDDSILEELAALSGNSSSANKVRDSYQQVADRIDDALEERSGSKGCQDVQTLVEVETELNALVHSRQQGREFSEMVALVVFAIITIAIALLARPVNQGVVGQQWPGFMTEMFMMLFAGTIAFLVFNLVDRRRSRNVPVLVHTQSGDHGIVYRVDLSTNVQLVFERTMSLVLSFGMIVSFGFLFYGKWF